MRLIRWVQGLWHEFRWHRKDDPSEETDFDKTWRALEGEIEGGVTE